MTPPADDERKFRKQKGDFAFLNHRPTREAFMARMSSVMEASNFILIAGVVDKGRLGRTEGAGSNPYHIALGLFWESLRAFLVEKGQDQVRTPCGG